jgi:ABC-type dipeptide/oligopeptide/nickel transport system permease component
VTRPLPARVASQLAIFLNLITDLLYGFLDPRVRLA